MQAVAHVPRLTWRALKWAMLISTRDQTSIPWTPVYLEGKKNPGEKVFFVYFERRGIFFLLFIEWIDRFKISFLINYFLFF